ncbi:MAG TPA: BON domain-containing protein [Candidatus Binatia bacterium]|nr:BON domain-containing protein [Candidatus Binatia bacterium]
MLAGAVIALLAARPSHAASDAWITAKTKMALLTTDGVSGTAINVDTVDGRVTLHGKVTSEQEKARAADVARKIDGTREVRNLLQVVTAGANARTDAKDDRVKADVQKALADTPQLAGSDITVESVNGGVVLLAGRAESFEDHLTAVSTAAGVPGVRRVASEIKSPDALADAEVRREGDRRTAGETAHAASATVSDAWITSQAKMRLLADPDTPALDVNVDTDRGVVTLFGMVSSDKQKAAAEADARKVNGVHQVRNELQVVPSSRQDAVEAKDDDLQKAVEQSLERRSSLAKADIDVEVKNGVVRLTGDVPSSFDRVTAAVAARSTPGVRSVISDDLHVKGEG